MTNNEPSSPPQAPPLALPPAVLHFAAVPPHPDSEASRQHDRHRTAQELSPIERSPSIPACGLHLSPNAPSARSPTIRSRGGSSRGSVFRRALARCPSEISTVVDSEGPEAHDARRYRLRRQVPHWYDPMVKLWKSQVSITIDEGAHRDHLALERTFLAYLRTSLALANAGVIIAQLFRLQHAVNPNKSFGFFILGIPLASAFIALGVAVLLIGAYRFWRQQSALVRGKVHAGGWEISLTMLLTVVFCLAGFVLVTAVDIEKTYF